MKHSFVIFSLIFYLLGIGLGHAAQAYCPSDSSTLSVLLAEEGGDKKDGETSTPEEEECE